ncbi:c-type cytochrome [Balneola vulgaris]|uniref:c-type cytochrome n=1 Tax=Balneola vulgaris TaxID=287535 RepID=UPI00047585BF|nr:c-type cytochrome [Balneola vulgaris]
MTNKNMKSSLMTTKGILKLTCMCGVGLLLGACRGQISEKPPIHPNMNMDQQPRMEAQEVNKFFEDNRSMRQPVAGTVARGLKKDDKAYYEGVDANGEWVEDMPVEITRALLYRGQDRYNVYCAPCHGGTGDGNGIIMTGNYGYVPAPTYHQARLREATDGELYSAIYNGVRTMPSYATQIKVEDRWAIVAYIRALQESQNASESELRAEDVDVEQLEAEYTAEQERLAALAEARKPEKEAEASIDQGKKLVQQYACETCHNVDGTPGGIGPTWKGLFGSQSQGINEAGETITINKDEAYIRESIVAPEAKKTEGYEQGVMAPYDYLSETELESLILYIKSLSDN